MSFLTLSFIYRQEDGKKHDGTHHKFKGSSRCQEPVATSKYVIEPAIILQLVYIYIRHNQRSALDQARLQMTAKLLMKNKDFS